jgi:hypothetical protein
LNVWKTLGATACILGFLTAITPHFIFPVCEYFGKRVETAAGMWIPMRCYYTALAEVPAGVLIIVAGLALVTVNQAETRKVLNVIIAALGINALALPYWIGVCASPMPCHVSRTALTVLGLVVFAIGIAGYLVAKRHE